MANQNVNLTSAASGQNNLSATMQTYYDRKMILNMKPKLVHYQYGQRRPLPLNNGRLVQFRKWTPFGARTGALSEGVVPDGQSLNLTCVEKTVSQYGGYVAVSDVLDMTALDPVVNDSVELMADQGALTVDELVREELKTGANVIYAAQNGTPAASRSALSVEHKLSSTELRKAVRLLKKNKAPQFMRGGKGYYVAIVSPDSVFDLQSDATWQDVGKYQESEQIFSGEIGRLFGVIVVESSEAALYRAADAILPAGTNINRTVTLTAIASSAYVAATPSIQVTATAANLGSAGIAALVGKYVVVGGERRKIVSAAAHSTAANGTILTLDAALTGTAASYNGATLYPDGGGATANDVYATFVFGRDAYGVIDLEEQNVRAIVKNRGSAGTADPLEQISTVGWKVAGFAAVILQDAWLVRVEHGVTA